MRFQCIVCFAVFVFPFGLQCGCVLFCRCHQTDKPYKCNSCYKCFIDENALLDHIPKHKESKHLKTHICEFCGKSYTQETYLAKHMQKHSDRGHTKAQFQAAAAAAAGHGQAAPAAPAGPVDTTATAYWGKVEPGFTASHDR